jgi:hypothetical protein
VSRGISCWDKCGCRQPRFAAGQGRKDCSTVRHCKNVRWRLDIVLGAAFGNRLAQGHVRDGAGRKKSGKSLKNCHTRFPLTQYLYPIQWTQPEEAIRGSFGNFRFRPVAPGQDDPRTKAGRPGRGRRTTGPEIHSAGRGTARVRRLAGRQRLRRGATLPATSPGNRRGSSGCADAWPGWPPRHWPLSRTSNRAWSAVS